MTAPQYVKGWLDAISGDEKFVMTLGAGVVDTLLLIFGFLDQSNYVILTMGTVATYIAGKTYENVQESKNAN